MRSIVEPRADRMRIGVARRLVVAADGADDGPPVELGEHQVEDDERRPVPLDGVEGGRAVGRGDDREPVALEVGPHEPDDLGVVVDDEDRALRDRHRGLVRHRQHGRGAMLGRLRDAPVTAPRIIGSRPTAAGGTCSAKPSRKSRP